MANETVITKQGEGTALNSVGALMVLKATHAQTNGKFTVAEMSLGPRALGAPPHRHVSNEGVYVLEGTIRHHLGDRTVELGAGSFIHIAAGTWEYFENATDGPCRLLAFWTDPDIHEFMLEAFPPLSEHVVPPPGPPPTPEQFAHIEAAAAKHGLEIKPPPM
jgi:quercetin dioxygenase-like cupin family protein